VSRGNRCVALQKSRIQHNFSRSERETMNPISQLVLKYPIYHPSQTGQRIAPQVVVIFDGEGLKRVGP